MAQCQLSPAEEPTIDDVASQLECGHLAPVARAAFDAAGDLATREYGRPAAVLAAFRLASRRSRGPTLEAEWLASSADRPVDPADVAAATDVVASRLSPPADAGEIRALRRRLIVAHELLAAARRGRPDALQLPDSYLEAEAPWLLGRTRWSPGGNDDPDALEEDRLESHVERLEADLEAARLGSALYALVALEEDREEN
ncbi:hypothetical protein [Natrarchaeobaculum aegyptiacum]|uniref:Uncharacterized protein n=1 Tax=Natrarchaeobaculum aegyptiacum TaxID=745377 RepID=A0A2Z2HSW1_9EURY|nr:hypothetical protein [Natrarchaeobaculum aegyptiacum]ARS90306.1 hypothetical protein B1756_11615 [Natrarchaeobaculum aegyptiacum]